MNRFLRFVISVGVLAGVTACASSSGDVDERLASQAQDQRALGARVSSLEERTDKLEQTVGLRSNGAVSSPAKVIPVADSPQKEPSSPPSPRTTAAERRARAAAPADPVPVREYILAEDGRPIPADEAAKTQNRQVIPYLPSAEPAGQTAEAQQTANDSANGPGLVPLSAQNTTTSAQPASPERVPAPRKPRPASVAVSPSGKSAYDAALSQYNKGQYTRAAADFASFIQSSPGSSLIPNAIYWQGECEYSLGKYDAAIILFKDVAAKYPKHPKAAASLLKAGYAYERLKDTENARFYWQLLLDDFPKSEPARLARQKMGAS